MEFSTEQEATYLKRIDGNKSLEYKSLSLFSKNFQYVSAARNSVYEFDDYAVEILKQISIKEGKGELTAQFLYENQTKIKVEEPLKHVNEVDSTLLRQTTAWEREISQGVNVVPNKVGDGYEIKYSFDTSGLAPTDEFSKGNVGFGLSYSLPIIVSILSSKPGSLILIENPEAHIHPYGQSKIAELISLASQHGIQIILETHSDHIINGILVQCKCFEQKGKGIDKENVEIYHLEREDNSHSTYVNKVEIEKGGRLKNKPVDFFDQIDNDLEKILFRWTSS